VTAIRKVRDSDPEEVLLKLSVEDTKKAEGELSHWKLKVISVLCKDSLYVSQTNCVLTFGKITCEYCGEK
jgi:hypothetical protein